MKQQLFDGLIIRVDPDEILKVRCQMLHFIVVFTVKSQIRFSLMDF